MADKPRVGLILAGGGARAAYQVGVLKAIAELLPRDTPNPFPGLCGTSAAAPAGARPGLRISSSSGIAASVTAIMVPKSDR